MRDPMQRTPCYWNCTTDDLFAELSSGAIGVAYKAMDAGCTGVQREAEQDMIFAGLLLFTDPPKPGIAATLQELKTAGVAVKIITGDNALVAAHIGKEIGLGGHLAGPAVVGGEKKLMMFCTNRVLDLLQQKLTKKFTIGKLFISLPRVQYHCPQNVAGLLPEISGSRCCIAGMVL
jgi:magnesium-transporting ATPase (P-type)